MTAWVESLVLDSDIAVEEESQVNFLLACPSEAWAEEAISKQKIRQ